MIKKILSIGLAACVLASAAISASANAGDAVHRTVITDAVPADADTNTYYFYMPDSWRNEFNDTYDGKSLESCSAGIYWWDGDYNCREEAINTNINGWPGYTIKETVPEDKNIFVARVPKNVEYLIWNNLVDGGEDRTSPVYTATVQTGDIETTSADNMIYVCDPHSVQVNELSGRLTYCGVWLYYYGNGEYGSYKTREEAAANNEVCKNGQWPGDPPVEPVPEYTPSDDLIYFDTSGFKNYEKIYCHIWEIGNASFFAWQSKKEACQKVSDNIYSYDLAMLDTSKDLKGGLQSGKDYCVIFSSNTGVQTHDTTMGRECIGDTLKLTGQHTENPVDSEKYAQEAVWTKNSDKFGPHLVLTSIGNVVGAKLCPNEKSEEVIGDWLPTYYQSPYVVAVDALANAYPKFGITKADQLEAIMNYIKSKDTGEDENAMYDVLKKAFAKAYPSEAPTEPSGDDSSISDKINISKWTVSGIKNKTYTGRIIKQKSILVSKDGEYADVSVKYKNNVNVGTATVTITGTGDYTGKIVKTFKITKAENPIKVTAKKTVTVKSKRKTTVKKAIVVKYAEGEVTYKTNNDKVTVNNGKLIVAKGLTKGKTIKVKITVTAKGDQNYESESITKTIKLKVK